MVAKVVSQCEVEYNPETGYPKLHACPITGVVKICRTEKQYQRSGVEPLVVFVVSFVTILSFLIFIIKSSLG